MKNSMLAACGVAVLLAVGTAMSAAQEQKAHRHGAHGAHGDELPLPKHGVAVLYPTRGNEVLGIIRLDQKEDHLHVTGTVTNLTPGKHGFHIHEFGDLRSPDGTSAGDHFSLEGQKHGAPHDEGSHAGDLGNIEANKEGNATVDIKVKGLKLHFVVGRTIVVHAGEDDLKSQPSGDSGARVALGVIGIANPKAAEHPKSTTSSGK